MVAHAIQSCLDGNDGISARFGGEEFVCLMPNVIMDDALILADKVLKSVTSQKIPFPFSTVSDVVTISIGLATVLPSEAKLMTDFIKTVDDLLYKAKRNGRNQIQYEKII